MFNPNQGLTFFLCAVILNFMLVIRFRRVGRKNDPAFRIVATERRSKPHSSGVEQLGSYHPKTKHTILKSERILYWIGKGAQVSPTVRNLLISKGVLRGKKIGVVRAARKEKEEVAKSDTAE